MFTVYVLYSESRKKIYIGFTSDLEGRLLSHNELGNGWTQRFRPWTLVHTELFETRVDAIKRERQLKTAAGRAWIWQLIGDN
jgi:putative endonuclease